jgi:IS30 family transposase
MVLLGLRLKLYLGIHFVLTIGAETLARRYISLAYHQIPRRAGLLFSEIRALDRKTMTFDNGKEFSGHATIAKALGVQCFFARPYHSWERGLNEHTNGLWLCCMN